MIALRPHHLLCMLTFVGRGYSAGFVANLQTVVDRLRQGESILLVEGPDDICAPLLGDPEAHCRAGRVSLRDGQALEALARLFGIEAKAGQPIALTPALLQAMRAAFRAGASRPACAGCEWNELCTDVAAAGFAASKLTVTDRG